MQCDLALWREIRDEQGHDADKDDDLRRRLTCGYVKGNLAEPEGVYDSELEARDEWR